MSLEMQNWQQIAANHLSTANRPLFVVMGPTASGKTAFSIELCRYIASSSSQWKKAVVINVDSRQLYKKLDIGTAKITTEEAQGIEHYLFDMLDPTDEVTVAWYKKEAEALITSLLEQQIVPVLVGGSMLYISAIVDGLEPLESAPPELRERLTAEYDSDDGATLYSRLEELDPDAAATIDRRNKPYVIRAVEICELHGEKASVLKKKNGSDFDPCLFGLQWEREVLHERINKRTELLLQSGWVEEVKQLLDDGYTLSDPGMKSHGYREIATCLLDNMSIDDTKKHQSLIDDIAAKTRQYAKRQDTWWRNDERVHWLLRP